MEAIIAAYQKSCSEQMKLNCLVKETLDNLRIEMQRLLITATSNQDSYGAELTQYNKEIRKTKGNSWRKFGEEV